MTEEKKMGIDAQPVKSAAEAGPLVIPLSQAAPAAAPAASPAPAAATVAAAAAPGQK